MKKLQSTPGYLLSISGAGLLVTLALAGCSTDESFREPEVKPSVTAASAVCDPTNHLYGDVIPAELKTDELGEYCHVSVDEDAEALQRNDSKLTTATLDAVNITADEAFAFQQKAVKFFGSEGVDSSALDLNGAEAPNAEVEQAWYTANAREFDESLKAENTVEGKLRSSNVVINSYLPELIRDGAPRLSKSEIEVNEVYGKAGEAGAPNQVVVNLGTKTEYRATDAEALAWKLTGKGATRESIEAEFPQLFDETGENRIELEGIFAYSYSIDSGLLVGNSFEYDVNLVKE